MFTRGDFHIHTTASDGSLSPKEVVLAARSAGIDTIAITDHNTTYGIDQAAMAGRLYGVSVIPGVELSTKYNGESIHILGYFRDESFYDNTFLKVLQLIKTHRFVETRRILCNFMQTEYFADSLSVFEGIDLLRAFGVAVVLAHPVRISVENLSDILRMPFDGIEARYCHNSYYDTSFFINIALSSFSFYTAGSDFHNRGNNCFIGQPFLNSLEIQRFFSNSGAIVIS
jgi:predicted metal-dependent phosphoesterase TrpH